MSKFNRIQPIEKQLKNRPDATKNYEGELAFKLDPRTDLYIRAASTLVGEPKYYESAKTADSELLASIHRVLDIDPEFVLQLAVYCREQLHLRSVPLMLLVEFANSKAVGKVPNARKYVTRCIQRADEIPEIISYQLQRNKIASRKAKLPMMIKYGVSDAFNNFDEYQFAKYNSEDRTVKLKDALFLTHPKPKNEAQQILFNKIVNDTLETPLTWEVMRSTGKMTWKEVIHNVFHKDGRINNYMAQLRNIRNCMLDPTVKIQDMELLCNMLSDKTAVEKSKQLPFRFMSAHRVIKPARGSYNDDDNLKNSPYKNMVLDALETAMNHSIENIPKLSGTTLIACDVSGSMEHSISKNSSVERYDIGIVLGMIAHRFCSQSITGFFGDTWKEVPMSKHTGILQNAHEMRRREGEVGYSTNGHEVIRYLLNGNIEVDRIMIFTDNQMWRSGLYVNHFAELFTQYQRKYPNVKLYSFDLSGYGTINIPQDTKNVCLIGGWSDKIFDFVTTFEENNSTAIDKIRAITP